VSRERITRALLYAYPARTRASLGAEMVGTLLESSDASRGRFARECGALVITGMRARARASRSEPLGRQLVDGYVLAGQIWLAVLLSHATAQFLADPADGLGGGLVFVLALWPILGVSLIGARRAAGLAAITWFVCLIVLLGPRPLGVAVRWLIPLSSCVVMAACRHNRTRDLRRLGWLFPVVVMSALSQSHGPVLGAVEIYGLILGSAVAVVISAINPRLLVACAMLWTSLGVMSVAAHQGPQRVALLALSAPLVLLATAGRVLLSGRRRVGS
jgi:hypothetical protein